MLKRLLLLTLCALLLMGVCACGEEVSEDSGSTNQVTPTESQKTYPVTYVPDETVNRFIVALKSRAGYESLDILTGNAPGEYIVLLNECQVTLSAGAHGMGVVILGGRGERGQKNLFTTFSQLARVADKSCTEQQIESAIEFMKQHTTSSSTSRQVCNEVKLISYSPSVQVGGTETDHRLDLLLLNYIAAN